MSALASDRTRPRTAPALGQQKVNPSKLWRGLTSINYDDRTGSCIHKTSDFLDNVRLEGWVIWREDSFERNLQIE
jgi:hypothetical protein